ncbi:MAG: hypothetical protein AAF458_22540 [Pseudomonadota bacterium]
METLLNVVLTVLWVVSVIGWLLMLIAGFKRSVWWGLGIFFLVIPVGIIFAIKYWEDAKLGCLLQLIPWGIIVAVLAIFWTTISAMFMQDMAAEMERLESGQGQAAVAGGGVVVAEPEPEPEPAKAEKPKPPERTRYEFQDTDFDFLPGSMGARVRIVTKDGREHVGEVTGYSGDTVKIRKRMSAGTFEFGVRKADAKIVQIYEAVQ